MRAVEATKFFLALKRMGLPVYMNDGKAMVDRFVGADKIGIVPKDVIPDYCGSRFPGE